MRPDYCDLTTKEDCTKTRNGHCKLCSGLFCSVTNSLNSHHRWLGNSQTRKSKDICKNYMNSLTRDLDAFWKREIKIFLPTLKAIITELNEEPETGEESDAQKRQVVNDGKGQKLSAKTQKKNAELNDMGKQTEEDTKSSLKGTSTDQSPAEYLVIVNKNNQTVRQRMKGKKKIKEAKKDKSPKINFS